MIELLFSVFTHFGINISSEALVYHEYNIFALIIASSLLWVNCMTNC